MRKKKSVFGFSRVLIRYSYSGNWKFIADEQFRNFNVPKTGRELERQTDSGELSAELGALAILNWNVQVHSIFAYNINVCYVAIKFIKCQRWTWYHFVHSDVWQRKDIDWNGSMVERVEWRDWFVGWFSQFSPLCSCHSYCVCVCVRAQKNFLSFAAGRYFSDEMSRWPLDNIIARLMLVPVTWHI